MVHFFRGFSILPKSFAQIQTHRHKTHTLKSSRRTKKVEKGKAKFRKWDCTTEVSVFVFVLFTISYQALLQILFSLAWNVLILLSTVIWIYFMLYSIRNCSSLQRYTSKRKFHFSVKRNLDNWIFAANKSSFTTHTLKV